MRFTIKTKKGRVTTIDFSGLVAAWILMALLGSIGILWSFPQAAGAVALVWLVTDRWVRRDR